MKSTIAVLLLAVSALSAESTSLSGKVRGPLAPVGSDGKTILAYEVEVENTSGQDLTIVRLAAFGDNASTPALSYELNELARNLKQIAPPGGKEVKTLKPGARVVVFCWIEFAAEQSLPHALRHEVVYRAEKGPDRNEERTLRIEPASVGELSATLVLGAPLSAGDWWVAVGPANGSEHRRAQVRVGGNAGAPFAQRFAIDFVELCGGMVRGGGSSNNDFCGYGKDVLAVADAQVAAAKDGIVENKPGEGSRAVKITLETLLGNYVVLDLGSHLFALYGHLQPGSLQVKAGDRVRRGQAIARLGNSGNSDAPHLHFHVGRAESVNQVESVQSDAFPYTFDRFELEGLYAGRGMLRPGSRQIHSRELPLNGEVVRFTGID
jgi:murein DD-endopeptidase MepM/ murein hydrolase activator NlpD